MEVHKLLNRMENVTWMPPEHIQPVSSENRIMAALIRLPLGPTMKQEQKAGKLSLSPLCKSFPLIRPRTKTALTVQANPGGLSEHAHSFLPL